MSELLTPENIDKSIQSLDHMRNYSQLGKTYDELLALNIGIKALELLKHRSPELREKMAETLYFMTYPSGYSGDWGCVPEDIKEHWRLRADKLLLLCPDEEAIRKDERERTQALALKAIANEPEFPSDVPKELWDKVNGDLSNFTNVMRNTVRLTKNGITERFLQALKEGE